MGAIGVLLEATCSTHRMLDKVQQNWQQETDKVMKNTQATARIAPREN
jgi:hypothetical protein